VYDDARFDVGRRFVIQIYAPKRRFAKDEQKRKCGFRRKHFSMAHGPNSVLTPLKSASFDIRISSFVPPSQIHAPQTKILEEGTKDEFLIFEWTFNCS
jgi:hypothetical protein